MVAINRRVLDGLYGASRVNAYQREALLCGQDPTRLGLSAELLYRLTDGRLGSLSGPPGPTGPAGPAGAAGATGPAGSTGAAGPGWELVNVSFTGVVTYGAPSTPITVAGVRATDSIKFTQAIGDNITDASYAFSIAGNNTINQLQSWPNGITFRMELRRPS
jgi:hypothetical protein